MSKEIDCSRDDRTLLEYVNQAVIQSGIKNLVIDYFFFQEIDDPDPEPNEHFSYSGSATQFEENMKQYAFIFQYRMNLEVQRVVIDPEKDQCYMEIWV